MMKKQGMDLPLHRGAPGEPADRMEYSLAEIDPLLAGLVTREAARQEEKITLIPSESRPHPAVLEALASPLTSLYAEGYAPRRLRTATLAALANVDARLAEHREMGTRRYYEGTEVADLVESIAERRAARCFASRDCPEADIYANVQALSGSAANLAIYQALLEPGDTILAMALAEGGHLTHGSPYSVSGQRYHAVFYHTDPSTERLDYDAIARLAREHQPKLIVGGFTSYPWEPDWPALRRIADDIGAVLLADVSHLAGLIVGDVCENPLPHADVVMFTTHKTLCGPRGAVILSKDAELARRIDRAVFPGLQGGPHVNNIAAIAVALHLAQSRTFADTQRLTVSNARSLADALAVGGLRLAYGGTNTHLVLTDLAPLGLDGGTAARALDRAGIVCNRNVLPGDRNGGTVRGIRFGTTWVSQWGWGADEMRLLAGVIARLVNAIAADSSPDASQSACAAARRDVASLLATGRAMAGAALAEEPIRVEPSNPLPEEAAGAPCRLRR